MAKGPWRACYFRENILMIIVNLLLRKYPELETTSFNFMLPSLLVTIIPPSWLIVFYSTFSQSTYEEKTWSKFYIKACLHKTACELQVGCLTSLKKRVLLVSLRKSGIHSYHYSLWLDLYREDDGPLVWSNWERILYRRKGERISQHLFRSYSPFIYIKSTSTPREFQTKILKSPAFLVTIRINVLHHFVFVAMVTTLPHR